MNWKGGGGLLRGVKEFRIFSMRGRRACLTARFHLRNPYTPDYKLRDYKYRNTKYFTPRYSRNIHLKGEVTFFMCLDVWTEASKYKPVFHGNTS